MDWANVNWGNLLFGFSGRIGRAQCWFASIVIGAVSLATFVLAAMAGGLESIAGLAAIAVVYIGSYFCLIAVGCKRLHDRDKSGWWLLLFYLVPSALYLAIGAIQMDEEPQVGTLAFLAAAGTAALAIGIWYFVEVYCLRGSAGPNRFGPDPLAPK